MDRRNFIASGLSATVLSSRFNVARGAPESTQPLYELLLYEGQIGDPFHRLESWAKEIFVPAMDRLDVKTFGCFTLALGVGTPRLMILIEHPSIADLESRWNRLSRLSDWQQGLEKLEVGNLPPYDRIEKRLLRATSYSPPLSEALGKSNESRFFEFRIYHSPTFRQLRALHQRFSGPEIKIFHRVGIRPILYADTVYGPQMPCLTYMMPFRSLAARETAWNKFRADPEWIRVRADSVARAGEIVSHTDRILWKAASYSPIQ